MESEYLALEPKTELYIYPHPYFNNFYLMLGLLTHRGEIETILGISDSQMDEFMERTGAWENDWDDIICDCKEDGEALIELLTPYYMAQKMAGVL